MLKKLLIDGVWHDEIRDTPVLRERRRAEKETWFRGWVSADGESGYKAEAGRYHLYVSYACPWAHRTIIVRKLKKLARLPWRDRLLLIEAAWWLVVARLAVLLVPFRWMAPRLGETMASSPDEDPVDAELPRRVGWAVGVASAALPWKSRCLAEAIAGKAMLRRRGVASTLYLGAARQGGSQLDGHAWLRCGSQVLIGERARNGHEVIASFAEPTPRGREG